MTSSPAALPKMMTADSPKSNGNTAFNKSGACMKPSKLPCIFGSKNKKQLTIDAIVAKKIESCIDKSPSTSQRVQVDNYPGPSFIDVSSSVVSVGEPASVNSSVTSRFKSDAGLFVNKAPLADNLKFDLLSNHWKTDQTYEFPTDKKIGIFNTCYDYYVRTVITR